MTDDDDDDDDDDALHPSELKINSRLINGDCGSEKTGEVNPGPNGTHTCRTRSGYCSCIGGSSSLAQFLFPLFLSDTPGFCCMHSGGNPATPS